jgi:hypothetical protein
VTVVVTWATIMDGFMAEVVSRHRDVMNALMGLCAGEPSTMDMNEKG